MDITWYGHSCFRLSERGAGTIVMDPYDPSLGYGELNLKGDIVTISHDAPGHNATDAVKKATYFLDRPGEYEIGGIFITGVQTFNPNDPDPRQNIVWLFQFADYTIAHLGDLDHVPTQSDVEAMGPIDVLLVPVGGGKALNSGQAGEVISLIEPSIVVPMHYQLASAEANVDLQPLDNFLKEMGVSSAEEVDTLKVTSSSLAEETQVVILKKQD
jgi:L-ascorbate metabolism protein UlaG (beta-lactamase superfamily)